MNRRQFLKTSAGAAALLTVAQRKAYGYAVSMRLPKFVQALPVFGGGGPSDPPVMTPDTTTYPGVDYYEVTAGVFRQRLHPNLPNSTRLYGYRQTNGAGTAFGHLGGAIVAHRNRPVRIKFTCALPNAHILPFDPTIPQGPLGTLPTEMRAAIHLHGGLVPWTSDGGPFNWKSNLGVEGSALLGTAWLADVNGALTNDYFYPNNQSARFMWYHDHAIGITRTNAHAGVASGYFVVDDVELALAALGLPIPGDVLVFQDKVFWDPLIDPGYGAVVNTNPADLGPAVPGDLWYPYLYDPKIWKLKPGGLPLPAESCVAEMYGDTMLVNGVVHPFQNVNGMKRYRLLNACNARVLQLSFALEHKNQVGEPQLNNKGLPVWAPVKVWQIGNECGFLPTPVLLADTVTVGAAPPTPLLLAPAERADIIVDFSAVPVGTNVILYNDAPAPFPAGSPMFDYSTATGTAKAGFSPNTRTILKFQRIAGAGATIPVPTAINAPILPTVADPINGGLRLNLTPGPNPITFNGANYRYLSTTQELTLNEAFDAYGRLMQLIGNINNPAGKFGSTYVDGPGETATYGTIQIWNIYNLTADTHPMHFHLFNVMVLRRRPFRVNQFNGIPAFTGPGLPPAPNELGWKETVRMNPGECTTVAVLVEDPYVLPDPGTGVHGSDKTQRTYTFNVTAGGVTSSVTTLPVPRSPRLATLVPPVMGDEYVWHCHILEHEEHDMMHCLVGQ